MIIIDKRGKGWRVWVTNDDGYVVHTKEIGGGYSELECDNAQDAFYEACQYVVLFRSRYD